MLPFFNNYLSRIILSYNLYLSYTKFNCNTTLPRIVNIKQALEYMVSVYTRSLYARTCLPHNHTRCMVANGPHCHCSPPPPLLNVTWPHSWILHDLMAWNRAKRWRFCRSWADLSVAFKTIQLASLNKFISTFDYPLNRK